MTAELTSEEPAAHLVKYLMLFEVCDATDVFVIDEKRRSPSSASKAEWEVENVGVADADAGAGAGFARLDWDMTGCCKTLSDGRLTVVSSEPDLFHVEVVESS